MCCCTVCVVSLAGMKQLSMVIFLPLILIRCSQAEEIALFFEEQQLLSREMKSENLRSIRPLATSSPSVSCKFCLARLSTGGNCNANCYSCGFGIQHTTSNDCVTCKNGKFMNPYYTDCTGSCTAESASTIAYSSCNLPCAHCGFPYHPFIATTDCLAMCETDSYTEGCFEGNDDFGPCRRCGFRWSITAVSGPDNCVACPIGYEIDVVHSDCTGYCVPAGTAANPIGKTTCQMPCSACGTEYDGFVTPPPPSMSPTPRPTVSPSMSPIPTTSPTRTPTTSSSSPNRTSRIAILSLLGLCIVLLLCLQ